jgi:hypothetical protein
MTTQPRQKLERAVALSALRQRNEGNFKKLGLINPVFAIKFAYVPKHREDMVISMFPSEMDVNDDIYLELTDGNNHPIHENAVLYKLRHNPFYKQGEYELIPPDLTRNKKSETYLIPVSELEIVEGRPNYGELQLEVVKKPNVKDTGMFSTAKLSDFSFDKETTVDKTDEHYSNMTIRDLAAILLKAPVSNKKWLNDIILINK